MRLSITNLLHNFQGIFQWEKSENRLRFDRIMATSLWSHVFGPSCTIIRISATTVSNISLQLQHDASVSVSVMLSTYDTCSLQVAKSLVVVKGVRRVARPPQLEYGSFPHLSPLLDLWSEIGSTLLAGFKHWIDQPSHLVNHRGISDVSWTFPIKDAWI